MKPKTVSKETPLAEITLRRYEKPSADSDKRDLARKFLLSIGLLSPGDSRDIIIDIFCTILENNKGISLPDLEKSLLSKRKQLKLPIYGIASSNIRRQLRRLKDMFLIEKSDQLYRISENSTIEDIFEEKIKKYYLNSILYRVKEYSQALNSQSKP